MKNEARRARKLRLDAAKRLIRQQPAEVLKLPKKPQHKARRMVPPVDMQIQVVKVAGA